MTKKPLPFGAWLRQTRRAYGWSMRHLSETSGIHIVQIHSLETGKAQRPRSSTRLKLYTALGEKPPLAVAAAAQPCSFCGALAEAGRLCCSSVETSTGICDACLVAASRIVAAKQEAKRPSRKRTRRPHG